MFASFNSLKEVLVNVSVFDKDKKQLGSSGENLVNVTVFDKDEKQLGSSGENLDNVSVFDKYEKQVGFRGVNVNNVNSVYGYYSCLSEVDLSEASGDEDDTPIVNMVDYVRVRNKLYKIFPLDYTENVNISTDLGSYRMEDVKWSKKTTKVLRKFKNRDKYYEEDYGYKELFNVNGHNLSCIKVFVEHPDKKYGSFDTIKVKTAVREHELDISDTQLRKTSLVSLQVRRRRKDSNKLFKIRSQINGNSGEATNSDDTWYVTNPGKCVDYMVVEAFSLGIDTYSIVCSEGNLNLIQNSCHMTGLCTVNVEGVTRTCRVVDYNNSKNNFLHVEFSGPPDSNILQMYFTSSGTVRGFPVTLDLFDSSLFWAVLPPMKYDTNFCWTPLTEPVLHHDHEFTLPQPDTADFPIHHNLGLDVDHGSDAVSLPVTRRWVLRTVLGLFMSLVMYYIVKQLNGNNGSWTNTDDHDRLKNEVIKADKNKVKVGTVDHALNQFEKIFPNNKFNREAAARRVKNKTKEVKTKEIFGTDDEISKHETYVHDKFVESQEKMNFLPKQMITASNEHAYEIGLNSHKAELKCRQQFYLVVQYKDHPLAYIDFGDGKASVVTISNKSSDKLIGTDIDGFMYDVIPAGTELENVVRAGPGYCYIDRTKGAKCRAEPAIGEVEDIVKQYKNTYIDIKHTYYFIPLYRALSHNFPCLVLKPEIERGCVQYSSKHFGPRGLDNFMDTVHYYIFTIGCTWIDVRGRPNIAKLHDGNIEYYQSDRTNVLLHSLARLSISTDIGKPWTVDSTECDMTHFWEMRSDFKVIKNKGFVFGPLDFIDDTVDNRLQGKIWKETRYIDFTSSLADFVVYNVTPNNFLLASKRILGARDNEELLTKNHQSYLAHLIQATPISYYRARRHILQVLGITMFDIERLQYDGEIHLAPHQHFLEFRDGHKIEVEWDSYLSSVSTMMMYLLGRMDIHIKADQRIVKTNWLYKDIYEMYTFAMTPFYSQQAAAQVKHTKQKLRQLMVNNQPIHDLQNICVSHVVVNVKREKAKPGKYPRLFSSYNAGAMYANEIPEFIKVGIHGLYEYNINGVDIEICLNSKMDIPLITIFKKLIDARSRSNYVYCTIYGDDCCISGNIKEPFTFNLDISSCDASNKSPIFYLIGLLGSTYDLERTANIIKQCMLPLVFNNPHNTDHSMHIVFREAFEGSGNVLTTVLNFIASCSIVSAICCNRNLGKKDIAQVIVDATTSIGYIVTIEDCTVDNEFIMEKLQFLKHSPFETQDGTIVAALNYGAIFRSFGHFDDNITKEMLGMDAVDFSKMSNQDVMDSLLSIVVKGLVHEPSSIIINSLRGRFNRDTKRESQDLYNSSLRQRSIIYSVLGNEGSTQQMQITDNSLCRRYDCTPEDLSILAGCIDICKVGQRFVTIACTNFFLVDYGLKEKI
jgi:hypothetical protein